MKILIFLVKKKENRGIFSFVRLVPTVGSKICLRCSTGENMEFSMKDGRKQGISMGEQAKIYVF